MTFEWYKNYYDKNLRKDLIKFSFKQIEKLRLKHKIF